MKNKTNLFNLYRIITGRTTHTPKSAPADTMTDQYVRQGYWPDRSQHYAGW